MPKKWTQTPMNDVDTHPPSSLLYRSLLLLTLLLKDGKGPTTTDQEKPYTFISLQHTKVNFIKPLKNLQGRRHLGTAGCHPQSNAVWHPLSHHRHAPSQLRSRSMQYQGNQSVLSLSDDSQGTIDLHHPEMNTHRSHKHSVYI